MPANKSIRGSVPGDYRTRRDDRILTYCCPTDDEHAGGDTNVFSVTMDFPIVGARRCEGSRGRPAVMKLTFGRIMTSFGDVEAAKVIESTVLIYEDITPDADRFLL
jgi:hypothetical protein